MKENYGSLQIDKTSILTFTYATNNDMLYLAPKTNTIGGIKLKTGLNLLLKTHNMNQSQLAEKIGVSQSLVSQWATGKQEMTKETQNKIIETIKNVNTPTANTNEPNSFKATSISTHMPVNEDDNKDDNAIEKLPKKAVTLEGKIKECKRHCLETYGFEILVVKIKE